MKGDYRLKCVSDYTFPKSGRNVLQEYKNIDYGSLRKNKNCSFMHDIFVTILKFVFSKIQNRNVKSTALIIKEMLFFQKVRYWVFFIIIQKQILIFMISLVIHFKMRNFFVIYSLSSSSNKYIGYLIYPVCAR